MYKWIERMFGGNSLPVERIRPAKVRVIVVVDGGVLTGFGASSEIDLDVCYLEALDYDQDNQDARDATEELQDELDLLPFKS